MSQDHAQILSAIRLSQSSNALSILKLSEPIASALPDKTSTNRSSDVSTSSLEAPTPSSLEADLIHYKELFSKLRFSYVEQVTKEKFIRSIVSDPPIVVTQAENLALEAELAVTKKELKAQKAEVAQMIEELENTGRELVKKYEIVQAHTIQLEELPSQIEHLQDSIRNLKDKQKPNDNPLLNMTLQHTMEAVQEKERECAELDKQLDLLRATLQKQTKETERAQLELQPLELKRTTVMTSAREAKKRKQAMLGGAGDDLEERGRWLRGVDLGLRGMLGVES